METATFTSAAGDPPRQRVFPGLLLCLVLSGASGLIYEVAWVRSLELVFGATSFAIATVLAAFMGGLALGSRLMGNAATRRLERFHPLRVYALIEVLIGACGLLVPLALRGLIPVYRSIWVHFHTSFATFSLWRFLLCCAVLLLPTALMGATLPIASRMAASGVRIGFLYACNTLGAVAGCALAGLALLPAIGLRRTEWLAAGLNLLAAAVAMLLSRRRAASAAEATGIAPSPDRVDTVPATPARAATLLIVLYAVSGGVAMVFEVAWSRLLVLVLGSSTYSYTVMLTTFLAGLALGAALGARLMKSRPDPLAMAALCQILVALSTYLGLFLMRELPFLYAVAHNTLRLSSRGHILLQLALASGLMILPTLGLGAMFPVTIGGLRPSGDRAPGAVGRAYSWNTLGAIAGSILAGFWLVPQWGSRAALLVGIGVSALLGLAGLLQARVFDASSRLRPFLLVAVAAFLINLMLAAPGLPPEILSSGVFRYAERYQGADRAAFFERVRSHHGEILMFKEGLTCTVTVFRTTAARTLMVNGKPDASVPPGLPEPFFARSPVARRGDLPTQVLVAQLPLLLAPRRDRVLVVGLGSGVSLGSTLTHPVDEVECVELEDAVVKASRLFDDESRAPLADPRVRLIVNDARNHLLVTRERYDAIISEPSNPWVTGAASLFTRDFFELAGKRLAPGGLFCQWIQLYEMTADDFRAILRSFAAVFPEVHLFRVDADAILVGSKAGAPLRLDAILSRFGGVASDFERIGIRSPEDLLAHYWIGGDELRPFLGRGPLNTDDNMLIEFRAPLRMLARRPETEKTQARELAGLFAGRTTGIVPHLNPPASGPRSQALFWARTAGSALERGYPDVAGPYATRSLHADRNPRAAQIYGDSMARIGFPGAARAWLTRATHDFPRDAGVVRSLVAIERAASDWPAVRRDARELARRSPGDRQARYWEGESLYRLGERHAARAVLAPLAAERGRGGGAARSALALGTAAAAPVLADAAETPELGLMLGTIDVASGRHASAIGPLREHLAEHPADGAARALLLTALEKTGRSREALAERRRLDPDAPLQAARLLSEAETSWDSGPGERIVSLLEEARGYAPDDEAIALLLARAYVRLGDRARAVAFLEEFLDRRPDRPWAVGYLGQLDAAGGNGERAALLAQRYLALTGRTWDAISGE